MLHLTNPTWNPQAGSSGRDGSETNAPSNCPNGGESVGERWGIRFEIEMSEEHQTLVLDNLAKIQDLVTVYFEVVYPM